MISTGSMSAAIDLQVDEAGIPTGFERLPLVGGFQRSFGPVYIDRARAALGFRAKPNHLNFTGAIHGGALAAFADMQIAAVRGGPGSFDNYTPTISVTTDCLAPGKRDDWIEACVSLTKETGSLVFTSAVVTADGEVIARTSAIYKKGRKAPDLRG